ncbi:MULTISPECIES: hypothetical protein [unclassified Oceanobacillus]|uniref:hypothetical protein n=1 Tax=unclassified Oceanobacillus TaxID=2630292 RepID=UPI001BE59F8C|nr:MULTISPECIES: hypothetical protein [unclassified Oceanobacillus]MBT2600938.1 hypothetical protein [Oceanobacillus sp. ISL-74]MBT2653611.1 hypothetical protein [Oceanobacillus sp. ISL-73]
MPKLTTEQLKKIDKPIEDIVHDLALLRVKSKMESGNVSDLGSMFATYVDSVDDFKILLQEDDNLKDFLKS